MPITTSALALAYMISQLPGIEVFGLLPWRQPKGSLFGFISHLAI